MANPILVTGAAGRVGGVGRMVTELLLKQVQGGACEGRGDRARPRKRGARKKFGASVFIDNKATNAADELQKLSGAQVILAAAPSSKAMSELFDGLGPNGKFVVVGADIAPDFRKSNDSRLGIGNTD